ncbi:MAG: hypothetical protein JKY65_32495 [Planctomycetes bacterium]|nr:hypothetical protein [Planctomycetota bacterium]
MPWTCKACQSDIADDEQTCPSCQIPKTHWTIQIEKTRTFQVSVRKVSYLRGVDRKPWPADPTERMACSLVKATRAFVLQTSRAKELMEAGALPFSSHLLFARLVPRTRKELTITLEIAYDALEVEELEREPFQSGPNEKGRLDVPFLFVFGPGAEEIAFEGIHVVDLSEDEGFAPEIELRALGKPRKSLPTSCLDARWDRDAGQVGETVQLVAEPVNAPDGTAATFKIYEYDADGHHDPITTLSGEVAGGAARTSWVFEAYEDTDDEATELEQERGYTAPEFVFEVQIADEQAESDLLEYRHWIEFRLSDHEGNPKAGVTLYLVLPDESQLPQETDEQGVARWEGIPPGEDYEIEFEPSTEDEGELPPPVEVPPDEPEDLSAWEDFFASQGAEDEANSGHFEPLDEPDWMQGEDSAWSDAAALLE